MKTSFTHHLGNSFYFWVDHVLAKDAESYVNKTGSLYIQTDERLSDTYSIYASPYKQWVYDSSQTGADIATTVYVNGTGKTRSDGVQFDTYNGRVVFTGADQPPSGATVTCGYAVKELNVYLSYDSEEETLFAKNYLVNDKWGRTPTTGVEPYAEAIPAVFINIISSTNDGFALGGLDNTIIKVNMTAITNDVYVLEGVMDVFRDKSRTIIPFINFTGSPMDEFFDLKTSPFNYTTYATDLDNGYFIETVDVYKASAKLNQSIGTKTIVGFIDFELSQQRYPRI